MKKISLTDMEAEELTDLLCNCLASPDPFVNNRIAEIVIDKLELCLC